MPESDYDVEYFVRAAHDSGQKLRVVSPRIQLSEGYSFTYTDRDLYVDLVWLV